MSDDLFSLEPLAPMSDSNAFSTLELKPELLSNLVEIDYVEMTLVQAETLPRLLAGSDVLARAKTGSGKTAASFFYARQHSALRLTA